jgi:transcriptional regulator with XRE-family HTH domain
MRSRLAELGISQSDLARTLGVSREQVSKWLSGRANLTLGTLSDMCRATGMQVRLLPQSETTARRPPRTSQSVAPPG